MFMIFSWMHHNRIQETKDNGSNQNTTKLNKLFNGLLLKHIKKLYLSSFFMSFLFEVHYQTISTSLAKQRCPPNKPILLTSAQETQSTSQGNH